MKSPARGLLLLLALFGGAIGAAWGWFHIDPPEPRRLRLEVKRELPGWTFHPEPLSASAQEILATTNLFNGTFLGANGLRLTVFAAEWRADHSRSMSVVQHTPDICWVGAGWTPSDLGQPDQVQLDISGTRLPFECRVFQSPAGRRELVLWCTLLGGAVLEESGRWKIEQDMGASRFSRHTWAGRRLGAGQFIQNFMARRSSIGAKQFLRVSKEASYALEEDLRALEEFTLAWVSIRDDWEETQIPANGSDRTFPQVP
jgi:hypothetical protein